MAITNTQAVRFASEVIRPFADHYGSLYYEAKALVDAWNAQGLAALVPNDSQEVVTDGSATDGRPQITGADVVTMVTRAMELVSDLEAADGAKRGTVLKPAVNVRQR